MSMGSQSRRRAIDWNTAQRVGELVASSTWLGSRAPSPPPRPRPRRTGGPGEVPSSRTPERSAQELAHDFARRVGEYTGLELPDELPPLELVDRPTWIAANLLTMRPMLDRVVERLGGSDPSQKNDGDMGVSGGNEDRADESHTDENRADESGADNGGVGYAEDEPGNQDGQRGWEARLGPLSGPLHTASGHLKAASGAASNSMYAASGHLLGGQLGAVTGILSQRVLGQYDVSLLGPPVAPRLLLLEPNLAAAAGNLNVDRGELTAWVAIHEITHAIQFAGAPWLRGHLGGLLEELLAGLQLTSENDFGALFARTRAGDLDLGKLIERAREGELLRLGLGEERWEIVERLQAAMSLIEGHAEHTMDAVGADVLPSLPKLRAALTRRRATKGLPWRVLEKLLGLELKMRQYEVGRRFCDAVVAEGGPRALAIAWRSAEDLPSAAELNEPGSWLNRVHVAA
jgi:putative hydrolase